MKKLAILSLFLASSFLLNGCSPNPPTKKQDLVSIGKTSSFVALDKISAKKKRCPCSGK